MISVLLVDDEPLMRSGLTLILESAEDIRVVAEADNGQQALAAINDHQPDVILLDVRMPVMDGLSALAHIQQFENPPAVVMLTATETDATILASLHGGAMGFLLKSTPPPALIAAVHSAAAGQPVLSQKVVGNLLDLHTSRPDLRFEALRARERDIARLISAGLTNDQICGTLFLSLSTVKTHISRMMDKLECTNRVHIAVAAIDAGRH